jgi:[acyl-carrier-protein] S-malonyltransferase
MESMTAVVFAGQGAQTVGMGRDLADAFPACRNLFERADAALGYGLSQIVFEGPEAVLTETRHCQPAIFVASVAAWTALGERGIAVRPAALAGLSLGEWTALHVAGALGFEDALRALEARGRFMQEACEQAQGGMVSIIGLEEARVAGICEATGVEIANINSPGQIVLSGERGAIVEAGRLAVEAGAKRAIPLNVAGAYHSRLMIPAADRLREYLVDLPLRTPGTPVYSNVTGQPHGDPAAMRDLLVRQVTSSVQWVRCVEGMRAAGVRRYLECGPGKVLTGLIKRIDRDAALHSMDGIDTLESVVAAWRG